MNRYGCPKLCVTADPKSARFGIRLGVRHLGTDPGSRACGYEGLPPPAPVCIGRYDARWRYREAGMRLTVRLFGRELLALSTEADEEPQAEDDKARDLSGGTTASMPVGFGFNGDQRWREHETPDFGE